MRPLWLCWVLWALPLAGPGAALTEERVLGSLLRQLRLSEAPVLDEADVERLIIPAHVRAQYVALLQRSHGARSRGKRFSQSFREVAGRFLVSEVSSHLLVFDMEQRLPPHSELVQAVLRLFQEPTLDLRDYGAQGNCDPKAPATEATRCCRREVYIDLQGMKWAENWVLEPPGFLAYECVGTCQQPPEPLTFRWPFLGPRQCIASETTSLPMIVSVPEGGKPRPQVVSLPNMRVQKCSCASDGAPVPRKLEP
ncbi:left-right determination factor 2-like [Neophocaena asiaeorientalis asiaeorientalis]|uniref:Left-right determination factor 2-like n=1 Tax=Neophocaena asiaeorientalis asiaeorientalis TaxID=1706337 RepID=A0A341C3J6_NEOAA|nr:left-right determination factor 2-like [Neophocaena asiaeorientalis asiaeorientalis]